MDTVRRRIARHLLFTVALVLAVAWPGSVSLLRAAAQAPAAVIVHDRVTARSPLLVGANPGLTTAPNWEAWLRDSHMNAAREWANMEEIEPDNEDGDYGNGVTDESSFQAARTAVLESPEANSYLDWSRLKFGNVDRRVGTYARLGIMSVVVIHHSGSGSTREVNRPAWMANVPRSWADLWEWWEYSFAVAYHTAREHGVTRFAIHSEPDRSVQGFTGRSEDYVRLLAHGTDAARAGVRAANPALTATIHAPGLAEPTARRGSYLRTVLGDAPADVDVVDYHQYGPSSKGEYAARVDEVRGLAAAAGAPRPLFISEYNVSRSGERGDVDDPGDVLALAEAQRQMVLAGVEGMLAYRFNFPSEFRNLSLVRSGPGSGRAIVEETFGYHVFKQFTRAVAGGKEVLALETSGPSAGRWLATRDDDHLFLLGIWDGADPLPVDIDLSSLGVEGRTALLRAAAPSHRDEIIARPTIDGGRLALLHPARSVILVTVNRTPSRGAPLDLRIEPADAEVERNRAQQLRAIGTFPDGDELDVSDQVSWRSADPATVRVNSTGLAIGLTAGAAELTVTWADLRSPPVALAVR